MVKNMQIPNDYLERVYQDRATAFDRLSRLFTSVDPDLPLQRGFARVMAGDRLVKSVAQAQAEGLVSLHFRDGAVGASIQGGTPLEKPSAEAISNPSRTPRKPREGKETGQQDLFS